MTRQPICRIVFVLAALFLAALCTPAQAGIIFVNHLAAGAGTGSSWTDAFTDLQDALDVALPGDSICVAAGTYYPSQPVTPTLRYATFQMADNVEIYGGFSTTDSTFSLRNWVTNITILSGDIDNDGVLDDDNCLHVVTGSGTDATAVLDGFTITGGNASAGSPHNSGGGLYNDSGSPTLANLIFQDNMAWYGAAMYNYFADPTITNATFLDNTGVRGGGIYNHESNPTITNALFSNNTTYYGGGGVFNYTNSSPTLTNVAFTGNTATYYGGAMFSKINCNPTIINATITGNTSGNNGGGMHNYESNLTITNTILWGNSAPSSPEILNAYCSPVISYSLIEGSGGSAGWDPAMGTDGGNNLDENPLFVNESGGDLRLLPASPAANAGDNGAVPGGVTTDLNGAPRFAGVAVDMGAYERPCPSGSIIYVDQAALGDNNGESWDNAFLELEWATCPGVTEIWVADGTYFPTLGSDRNATFQLFDGVSIYGGFAGGESSVSQRDWATNVTILSGDIETVGNDDDNSYHVVTGSGTDATAVLDGFTITQGYANGAGVDESGGGMITVGGSPTVVNATFSGNHAIHSGGGMYNYTGSNPTLTNVTFWNNAATYGGGMHNDNSNPTVTNVIFSGNSAADYGGGMYNWDNSNPTLTNVAFWNNTASGGAGMTNNNSMPMLANVTFSQNSANYGGGIFNWDNSNPMLVNTILWNNSASTAGDEISNGTGCVPVISYSLIGGSGGSTSWDPALGTDGGDNIDADPMFLDEATGDLRLLPLSPAVDAGDGTLPGLPATDIEGNPRIVGANIDMGAYESQSYCPAGTVLYVSPSATGLNNGTSWADAFTELRHALDWVVFCPNVTEIWVAAGTYKPAADTDRTATFRLTNGLAFYGGFAGAETFRYERDWTANPTVLSGDIGVVADSTDNCYHVVTASGTDATAVLDGFTITGGNADAPVTLSSLARSDVRSPADTKPTIAGGPVTGSRSSAAWMDTHGGGIYNNGGSPTLANLVVSGNYASDGGGMYNDSGSPTLTSVRFLNNTALWGAGLHNYDGSNPVLANVVFRGGTADFGGAMYNNWSNPQVANATTTGNTAYRGGAMYNSFSDPVVVNTILWDDLATDTGNEIYNTSSDPDYSYSLIEGSGGSAGWDDGLGGDLGDNIDDDPFFADAPAGDLSLYPGSPAIDAGDGAVPNLPTTDIEGNPRIAHVTVDMGAYESQATLCPTLGDSVLYVDASATGANDGSTWSNAFTDLNTALYHFRCPSITEIWVAAGTYYPTSGSDRTATFQMVDSIAIYGGFGGWESMRSERDWLANTTILSGDIGIVADSLDNSYHVVTASGTNSTAVLDGFTIIEGCANGAGTQAGGGGVFTSGGSSKFVNLNISDNTAYSGGGGMKVINASPAVTNVVFSNNYAGYAGGGAQSVDGEPRFVNVAFLGNTATDRGGGFHIILGDVTFRNVTFWNNAAEWGGGMAAGLAPAFVVNAIFWGNSATNEHEIYNGDWGANEIRLFHSLIQDGIPPFCTSLGNNVFEDPLFARTADGDLRLAPGSPAIDTGDSTAVPGGVDTDLGGNPRIVGAEVDMGAYEFQAACPPDSILYVNAGTVGGAHDGSSWADAFYELRYALDWVASCPGVTEIWVAEGTYKPTADTLRTATIQLVNNVAVYGGFAGNETSLSQRDWTAYPTILSGDIGVLVDQTDNSYHVVTGTGTDAMAVLDGFTITGGYADGVGANEIGGGLVNDPGSPTLMNLIIENNYAYAYGGGMYNYTDSEPTVTNVVFISNSVDWEFSGGGGMQNSTANPTLTNVTFTNNSSAHHGGGMSNWNSNPTLVNVEFTGNTAARGGGMLNDESDPLLVNVAFCENTVTISGGGMNNNTDSSPTLINVTIVGNSSDYGGGIFNIDGSDPTVVNTILWGNSASSQGQQVWNNWSNPTFANSLMEGGLSSGCEGTGTQDCHDYGNNIEADPLFLGEATGDLRLLPASPAIDAGVNDSIPGGVTTDLDGNPRIANEIVDMGAYEYHGMASLMVTPSSLVFDQVPGNQTTCDTLLVINVGGTTCTINGIYGCDTAPFSADTTSMSHSLPPGDTTKIAVCVNPTVADPDTAEVTIVSDAGNSPTTVQVRIDIVTAVGPDRTPKPFRIVSISPNPFNPTTTIHFTLPSAMPVTAVIWSVTGARVRVLARDERFEPGDNKIVWDGRTDKGTQAASGVYFIRFETPVGAHVARAVMLK
jgi:hypothetical protein